MREVYTLLNIAKIAKFSMRNFLLPQIALDANCKLTCSGQLASMVIVFQQNLRLMRHNLFVYILFLLAISLLTGCDGARRQYDWVVKGDTNNLTNLQDLHVERVIQPHDKKHSSAIRLLQIDESSMSLAAQAALANRSKQINTVLSQHEKKLDRIFNFRGMVMRHHVLPPVLVEGRDTLNLADSMAIRLADRTYKIEKQARFVTNPPTWRDYLWMNYSVPETPHASLLPRNDLEREHWQKGTKKGWAQGLAQAEIIFQENLAQLKRDYIGMANYKKLLAQHVVSKPYVASTQLGVTGNSQQVRVNDKVLRITALPKLQTDSTNWKAVVLHE